MCELEPLRIFPMAFMIPDTDWGKGCASNIGHASAA